jgi:hypothetical protein
MLKLSSRLLLVKGTRVSALANSTSNYEVKVQRNLLIGNGVSQTNLTYVEKGCQWRRKEKLIVGTRWWQEIWARWPTELQLSRKSGIEKAVTSIGVEEFQRL